MKKFSVVGIVVVLVLVFSVAKAVELPSVGPFSANEEAWKTESFTFKIADVGGYWSGIEKVGVVEGLGSVVGGALASYFIHEISHDVVASLEGVSTEWDVSPKGILLGRSVHVTGDVSAESMRNIIYAGLSEQISTTELVIATGNKGIASSSYILSSGLNEIFYPLAHFLSKDGYGDFGGLEESGGNSDVFAGVVLSFGIRHLYILAGGKDPLRSLGPIKFDIALDSATNSAMAKLMVRF